MRSLPCPKVPCASLVPTQRVSPPSSGSCSAATRPWWRRGRSCPPGWSARTTRTDGKQETGTLLYSPHVGAHSTATLQRRRQQSGAGRVCASPEMCISASLRGPVLALDAAPRVGGTPQLARQRLVLRQLGGRHLLAVHVVLARGGGQGGGEAEVEGCRSALCQTGAQQVGGRVTPWREGSGERNFSVPRVPRTLRRHHAAGDAAANAGGDATVDVSGPAMRAKASEETCQ